MRRIPLDTFDRPWLLLCEGEADKRFFDRLIEARGIDQKFQVTFPDRKGGRQGGRSLFGSYLNTAYQTSPTFQSEIKAVLVVSDNDDEPAVSLAEVQTELQKAGFPVPNQERTVARKQNYPDVVILMLPIAQVGNLETLCLPALYQKWPLQVALDSYVTSAPANAWGVSKQSKMRVQTVIASTCKDAPDASFANHWHHGKEYHMPLEHAAFDQTAEFLRTFEALLHA